MSGKVSTCMGRTAEIALVALLLLWGARAHADLPARYAPPDTMGIFDTASVPARIVTSSKAMFVYIVFPESLPSSAYPEPAWRDSITTGFDEYYYNQSNGDVDFESFIVENPARSDGWWIADLIS